MTAVGNRGSVLLEQLLAMSLLGLIIAAVFGVLATGSLTATIAQNLSLAGELAAGKLEELSAGCRPLDMDRQSFGSSPLTKYEWRASVAEIAPGLCQATVTVRWPERGRHRSVTLTTLSRQEDQF